MSDWDDEPSWDAPASTQYQKNNYSNSDSAPPQNNWRNNDQNNSNFRGRGRGGGGGGGFRGRGGGGANFGGGGGGNFGRGGGGGNFGRDNSSNNAQGNATILKVPSKCVGKIIGKGGSKINDLQFESDCKIMVTKETEDDMTIIKLIGSQDNITRAVMLINDLTVEREPRESRQEKSHNYLFGNNENTAKEPEPEISWKELNEKCEQFAKEKWAKLPPIQKEFYQELPEVTNMTPEFVAQYRLEHNNIVVARTFADKGSNKPIPNPITTFHEAFHNFPEILDEIKKVGFETPSPIQSQAWPVLLSGEDLIGIAQTGTGKTLAFLLPALIHIDNQKLPREERGGPGVLVMAPTRELALQIEKEVKKYYYKGIKAVCLYGGGSRRDQINIVNDGVDIVIATPGRLNDIVAAGHIDPESITYVVLDEADRMLDMGFEPQIRKMMYAIRPNRQTVMTSATWPMGVRRLAQSYMVDPVQVYVGSLDLAAVHTVTQTIVLLPDDDNEKFNTFMDFALNLQPHEKVICFCGKKAKASFVASELVLAGVDCASIHGDLEQSDREQALVDIGDGTVKILVATDVASRGIDIEDITHVVNYDFPRNIEEYVHRVGRTGRAGKSGDSISYLTRADWGQAKELIEILTEADQFVPEELHDMAKRFEEMKIRRAERPPGMRGGGGGGFGGRGRGGGGGYGGGGYGGGGGGGYGGDGGGGYGGGGGRGGGRGRY